MADQEPFVAETPPSGRLTPADRKPDLLPWVRAKRQTRCLLYWMPAHSFPLPIEQKKWLETFLTRLAGLLKKQFSLRPEVFLQMKSVNSDLRRTLLNNATALMPTLGLSRRPHSRMPPEPSESDLKALQEGSKKFSLDEYVPDYCYWFLNKSLEKQTQLFLGYGGMTIMFLKPDPATEPPKFPAPLRMPKAMRDHPMFKDLTIEKIMSIGFSLHDAFLAKSKGLFGADLEEEPKFKGLRFVIPLLRSADFFADSEVDSKKWFELFDVYVNESPADRGVLMASKPDFEEPLIGLLADMRKEGLLYPGRKELWQAKAQT
jgi:hypothetical protein